MLMRLIDGCSCGGRCGVAFLMGGQNLLDDVERGADSLKNAHNRLAQVDAEGVGQQGHQGHVDVGNVERKLN